MVLSKCRTRYISRMLALGQECSIVDLDKSTLETHKTTKILTVETVVEVPVEGVGLVVAAGIGTNVMLVYKGMLGSVSTVSNVVLIITEPTLVQGTMVMGTWMVVET